MNGAPNNRAGPTGRPQSNPIYTRRLGPYLVPSMAPQAYQPFGPYVGPYLAAAVPPQVYQSGPYVGSSGRPQVPSYYQIGQNALAAMLGPPGSCYVPTPRGGDVPLHVDGDEMLYRRVQSLLDILSLANVDAVAGNFKLMLTIDSQERLQGVVEMVFKAAIQESASNSWPEMYALLVKEIFTLPVSGTADKSQANFLKLIVGRCQAEFDSYDNLNDFMKFNNVGCADSETEQALLELLGGDLKMHVQSIRSIRFMSKLFKHGLLPPPIMIDCLKRLLDQKDDESFQCLHTILTESGKKLEANEELNDVFEQIQKVLDENSSSKRIRFYFQDVINLRANNWVPKREETGGIGGSPENRVYSRDFLLKLQEDPSSKVKPLNLPDMDVVLDSTNVQEDWPIGNEFITFCRSEEVKLRESENAWKPTRLAASDIPEEQAVTQTLYKQVRSVLNKLTLEKFETLVSQIHLLEIDTKERMDGVINLVFEKAIDEPNFGAAYALMCKELALKEVSGTEPGSGADFKNCIITRYQSEFEKNNINEEFRKSMKAREFEKCTDAAKKKELQARYEEEERRIRLKSLNNIRFMGKLFEHGLLPSPIMIACLKRLLAQKEDESFQCLHTILTECGKKLEANEELNDVFEQIQKIVNENSFSKRVRFYFQDVIKLRANNWVPRREETGGIGGFPENEDPSSKFKPFNFPDLNILLNRTTVQEDWSIGKQLIISFSRLGEIRLRESENAWKPKRLAASDIPEEQAVTQTLYKKVRCLLNKLTLEKFETLVSQIHLLEIDTKERMDGVINLVFEKAIDEPNFGAAYALMCKELALKEVSGTEPGSGADFKNCIITRCQLEFEKNHINEKFRESMKAREIEKCTDAAKKKELQARYEEEERRIRLKSLNNIRFMGKLFEHGLLPSPIMIACLKRLLEQKEDESFQCLHSILTESGKKLEANEELNDVFEQIQKIVNENRSGKRMRFYFQDVINLRANNWVPRREETGGIGGSPENWPIGNPLITSLSRLGEIRLRESENAWKPKRLAASDIPEEQAVTQTLYKKVRCLLNKLTLEKFETLVSRIHLLEINTKERMDGVINLVFEKAIDEPNFCAAYSLMCKELALKQALGTEPGSVADIKNCIITRCQSEFEKNHINEKFRESMKAKEFEKCTDAAKKKELQARYEEEERRIRLKSLNNIRFIGELFKQGLLTRQIMHFYINNLLQHRDEENLECLCKLLTIIGKYLETDDDFKDYIKVMQSILNDMGPDKISYRVRFMIQDVIALSLNKWVPKRGTNNPRIVFIKRKPMKTRQNDNMEYHRRFNLSENAWKSKKLTDSDIPDDEAVTQTLYKKVRSLLNKLTPQKFDTLVSKLSALKIDTKERMNGVINLVFEKAIDEPSFSVAYALICKELALMQVSGIEPGDTSATNFRKLIINRCQSEFEKDAENEKLRVAKAKKIKECTDTKKKKELQAAYEEEERKRRMKSVRNIRFIGELFKLGMLTKKIMHYYIKYLLQHRDEESLECLCQLLTTIGKNLETNDDLRDYITIMKSIMNYKGPNKISSRVRFMIQDVIDLRSNKWVPTKDDNNPKTMDQIQREAESERLDAQFNKLFSPPNITLRNNDRGGDRRRNRGMGGGNSEDGGWIHPSKTTRTAYSAMYSNFENNYPLMFNLTIRGRSMFQPYEVGNSQADDHQPERSADELRDLINWIVEKYIADGNCEAALLEIKDNFSSSQLPMLIREMVNAVIEKSSVDRERISKLLSFLLLKKAITLNDFRAGFDEIFGIIGIMIIDIPKIWTYLADILMYLIMDDTHPISELKATVATLRSNGLSGKLIGELFSNLSKIIGQESVAEKWRQSGLQFSDIINTERENVDEIVKNYELQFLSSECSGLEKKVVSNKSEKSEDKLKNLTIMIVEENAAKIDSQAIPESNSPRSPELYARMVKEIITMPVSGRSDFLIAILDMCQAEFDSYFKKEDLKCTAAKKIEECTDPEKKQELQKLLEEEQVKMRMISIRNIWFMAELFKHGVLPPPMMLACMKRLLEQKDDDSSEFLHKLLLEYGEKLEIAEELNDVFEQMQKIVNENGSTKKVRFLFQDLINMRAANWVSKKN